MTLSKTKLEQVAAERRRRIVGEHRNYLDANTEAAIRLYLETGEVDQLNLPDEIQARILGRAS